MASPPNRALATSPVYPPHISLPNPKKRSSLSVTSQSSSKRRKPSSVSVSTPATSHPLRQTSFPPEESAVDSARSPSVESDVTGVTGGRSVVTAGTGIRKGKGRRRRKGEGSVKSGSKAPAGEEGSGSGHVGDDGAEEEEEDGEGEGDETLMDDGEKVDRAAEKKNLAYVQQYYALQNQKPRDRIANFFLFTVSLSMRLTLTRMNATICFGVSSSRKRLLERYIILHQHLTFHIQFPRTPLPPRKKKN